MRILVTGKNGQLGRSISKLVDAKSICKPSKDFIFADRGDLNLSNLANIESFFEGNRFDVIINCAAYTAVDAAEKDIKLANQVNHLAVKKISEIACKNKTHLIHISTDYVFDGLSDVPYSESDVTNPINVYGKTKLAGENAVKRIMTKNATIVRTSWVYSEFGNNFVKTMLRLGEEREQLQVINDQRGSPTYAVDLAEVILQVVDKIGLEGKELPTEIYHYSNQGTISWYDFAEEIFKLANVSCNVVPVSEKTFKTVAKRPKNTSMSKFKIQKEFGVEPSFWVTSLTKLIDLLIKESENYLK
jgi:dTDP-4-dehydrorhamnose reductase